ncbi:MAG TPA: nucleotide sugar dehydrogenase [Candidatus Sumerlaeota bacterium]|nr:nucleotide sugar dehydrogenase [Candidatus Sumerlaeota bacterium]
MNISEIRNMKLCVLGLGYIGLPSASMFATHGFEVLGVDVRPEIVQKLNNGEIHIEEPGLATLVEAAVKSGRMRASVSPEPSDAFIIAVPTPITETHGADMSYVRQATEAIVPHLRPGNLVILESTSPPRTCADIIIPILSATGLIAGRDYHLAHTPERVLPGQILKELIANDRIIGGVTPLCAEKARDLYRAFVQGEIFLTDATTAEMTKLVENTFRDVNIALANELARVCEKIGTSVWEVIRLANRHPRVRLHTPGPGVGGHCIAVDPWFLVESAPDEARLIRAAREINDGQPARVMALIERAVETHGPGPIAFFGLTYKPDVDDTRESPSFPIVRHFMKKKGQPVIVHDPNVKKSEFPLEKDFQQVVAKARYLVFLVGHRPYRESAPDFSGKVIIDTINMFGGRGLSPDCHLYTLGKR